MLGLHLIDFLMIVFYFVGIIFFGLWMSRRVKTEEDYFIGGRKLGKAVLVFHTLCSGTHTDNPVQVAGAAFRVGLGGIWYQWMWLFCTPFYWMIPPITRRLRYISTGDFFRERYSRNLEKVYAFIAIAFYVMTIAQIMLGAGKAIQGATAGQIKLGYAVIFVSVVSAIYVMTGGLVAAAYTDIIQGLMIILLSIMLIPFGIKAAGGGDALAAKLSSVPGMLSIVAPPGAKEGTLSFIIMMSLISLTGIVVQPHVMTMTGAGKTELEARVGMCYGNFVKRFLTIAWTVTGVIGFALFAGDLTKETSEQVWGRSIQTLLPVGFRGLMLACMLAGVTACETYMVCGSSIFTRNFYEHISPNRDDKHYLLVGRIASLGILLSGIACAFAIPSLTELLKISMEFIGFMGAAFWVGVYWRRANAWGVWASVIGTITAWAYTNYALGWDAPHRAMVFLPVEFGLLIIVSLLTNKQPDEQLDPFFAKLHTSVADEGKGEIKLDPNRAKLISHPDFEIPKFSFVDIVGFVIAWVIVAGLIAILYGVAKMLGG